ncbi:MAG: DAK2 domain-containing protein [Ruminococcaceae bacterium]|nr:DAK2 domain-containing protein [Oscillospiraceae bacterium]
MESKKDQKRKSINGADYKRLIINAAEAIKKNEREINDLNVFPVPDGDTGSNMSMTISSAADDLRKLETEELGEAANKAASSMLRGARGNSGVILSLLFRGISKSLIGIKEADGKAWAKALKEGVQSAYKAVDKPAEGTILTVARRSAEVAEMAAEENNSIEYVQEAAVREAESALDETIEQNPVLKKAGVVDAGGKGWLLALKSMLSSLRGKDETPAEEDSAYRESVVRESAKFDDFDTSEITFTYCTECIIDRKGTEPSDGLRSALSAMGDSLVLVDDEETTIKIHVHTNEPLAALELASAFGDFVNVKVENMRIQHTSKITEQEGTAATAAKEESAPAVELKKYGMVSVCTGDGISGIFTELGCDAIISGGQTMNPSTEDILKAVESVPAEVVFVFPNNKNIILAAEQAAALTEKKLIVIPSKSVPGGIMAMVQFNPEEETEENREVMTAALDTVDSMEVTYAARDSSFDDMEIKEGDYMGMYERKIVSCGDSIAPVLQALADKAVENGRVYINIYYGGGIDEAAAESAAEIFRKKVEPAGGSVDITYGGQPIYYYLISAE